jgi:hypothetical protein
MLLTENGWNPAIEEINIIEPLPLFSICGTADLASKNAVLTLISKILSQASSGHCLKRVIKFILSC